MKRQQETNSITAKNWSSLLDFDELKVEAMYCSIVVNLGAATWNEKIDEMQARGEAGQGEAPDVSDPVHVYEGLCAGVVPTWWPGALDRIQIQVRTSPDDDHPNNYGPMAYDPNTKDFGLRGFVTTVKNLCESIGVPYSGGIEIQITRKKDKAWLGGWRGLVEVGTKRSDKRKSGSDEFDNVTEYALKSLREKDESMLRMFNTATGVIGASASAINAMRGVNAAPPWMKGDGGEDQPMWMQIASEAAKVVLGSGVLTGGNQELGQAAGKILSQPAHRQLTGPTQRTAQPQQDLGYDQYLEAADDGDYDGFYASDEDMLEEDYGDPDYDEQDGDEQGDEEDGYDAYEDNSSGNPLTGKSPEEVATLMEEWLGEGHDKNKIRSLGMKLVPKIL